MIIHTIRMMAIRTITMNMTADMNMNMIIKYKKHDNAGNIDDDGDHEYFFSAIPGHIIMTVQLLLQPSSCCIVIITDINREGDNPMFLRVQTTPYCRYIYIKPKTCWK